MKLTSPLSGSIVIAKSAGTVAPVRLQATAELSLSGVRFTSYWYAVPTNIVVGGGTVTKSISGTGGRGSTVTMNS